MAEKCDVLVVGAGVAGVPAAVAAARTGASVIAVEKRGTPGGAGVAALHQSICGLYTGGDEPPARPLNAGITAEICERLSALSPNSRPARIGRAYVLPYAASDFACVYGELLSGARTVETMYDTEVVDVAADSDRISSVACRRGDDTLTIEPRTVLDCSGTGVVLKLAAADTGAAPEEERQLAGFTVMLSGLTDFDEALAVKVAYALRAAVEAGHLPDYLRFTSLRGGPAGAFLKLSLPAGSAPERRAQAISEVGLVCRTLAETLPEFENADIADSADEVMDRDGPRLRGEYSLTEDDVLTARKFDDAAARGAWPIEFWHRTTGPSYKYVPDGDWYDIPLRCLRSNSIRNLLCAGRCISVTPRALASTRVMGICMALGAAAGTHAKTKV